MALRLAGTAAENFRTTDHSEEIRRLILEANAGTCTLLERHARLASAALLSCHDATGISLDGWTAPRDLVEHLLGHEILESGISCVG